MNKFKKIFMASFLSLAFIFTVLPSFATSVEETYGLSASSIAQGNAVNSFVDNWTSVYYNMAGLGRTTSEVNKAAKRVGVQKDYITEERLKETTSKFHDEMAINYTATVPMMKVKGLENLNTPAISDDYLRFGAIGIGMVLDLERFITLPKWWSSLRFGLGLGLTHDFYSLDADVIKLNSVDARANNYLRYGCAAQRICIDTGLGMGFANDMFGFGVGATMLAGGKGDIGMKEVQITPTEQFPIVETFLNVTGTIAPVAGMYFDFGKAVKALKGLNLGFSYRSKVAMDMNLKATAVMTIGGLSMPMGIAMYEYFSPHTFNGGLSYMIPGKFGPISFIRFSADFEYQMWSGFKLNKAAEDNFKAHNVALPKFKDVIMPKVGFSLTVCDMWRIMGGYYYQSSMLTKDMLSGNYNFMDNDKHVASLGLTVIIPQFSFMTCPIEVTLAGQCQILPEQDASKTSDAYDSTLNPGYKYSGIVPSVSLEISLKL